MARVTKFKRGAFRYKGGNNVQFAGDVDILGTVTIAGVEVFSESTLTGNLAITTATDPKLTITDSTNTCAVVLQSLNTTAKVGTTSAHDFLVVSNNSTRITVASAGTVTVATAAVFSSTVTLSSAAAASLTVTDTTTPVTAVLASGDASASLLTTTGHPLILGGNSTTALTLTGANGAFAGTLTVASTLTVTGTLTGSGAVTSTGVLSKLGSSGSSCAIETATTSLTTNGGAGTQTATNLIPANSLVLAVVARVTTEVTGAGLTTFSIGDGSDSDRWGTGIALAAGTTSKTNTTAAGAAFYASATSVVLTAAAGQFDAGVVRLVVFYVSQVAPTS